MRLFFFFFSFSWAAITPLALACSCMGEPPPITALQQSAAVFSGKVVSRVPIGSATKVTFRVYRVWKGRNSAIRTLTTPSDEASCGVDFSRSDEWLVYAFNNSGRLDASLCSRTMPLAQARADLKILGKGTPVYNVGLVLGVGLLSCWVVWRSKRGSKKNVVDNPVS